MKRFVLTALLLSAIGSLVFLGCATTRGIGADIKSVGQTIEKVAD